MYTTFSCRAEPRVKVRSQGKTNCFDNDLGDFSCWRLKKKKKLFFINLTNDTNVHKGLNIQILDVYPLPSFFLSLSRKLSLTTMTSFVLTNLSRYHYGHYRWFTLGNECSWTTTVVDPKKITRGRQSVSLTTRRVREEVMLMSIWVIERMFVVYLSVFHGVMMLIVKSIVCSLCTI